jgi:KEOPS complex subunit Cgi121
MCKIIGGRVKAGKLDPQTVLNQSAEFAKKNDVVIQLFNAELIYGQDHLISAYEHAKRVFDQNRAISDTLGMEILLYAAGEYQIKNALAKLGIKEDTSKIAIILVGALCDPEQKIKELLMKLGLYHDDDVLTGDQSALERFGISQEELAAVPREQWMELILERVALLDIRK